MKNPSDQPADRPLSELLREARVSPALPPRFQESVWRLIEASPAPARTAGWLESLAALLLRPRFAVAAATALLFAGILLGSHEGSQLARQDAQARYIAAVMPGSLR